MIHADVIVVGAGGSGAVVAARLSENPDRKVLLLESGEAWSTDQSAPGHLLRDASSLRASMDPRTSSTYASELSPGRPWGLARGRAIGGSTAVNAGYFIRATSRDHGLWAARLGWSESRVLTAYDASETDLDHLGDGAHGSSGPIQVKRPPQDDVVTQALQSAAASQGLRFRAVPRNVTDGCRWDTGRAYLEPARSRRNLEIVTGAQVIGLTIAEAAGRTPTATGVTALLGGRPVTFEADEIVLCAGAIGTAHLLLLSGIGPAQDLEHLGRTVVADLPVGLSISDHPQVAVGWTSTEHPERPPHDDPIRSVLHTGDLELLPLLRPTQELLGHPAAGAETEVLDLLVADQVPDARGTLRLDPLNPAGPPLIRLNYLESDRDRATLRSGVRLAATLLAEAGTLAAGSPTSAELASDNALDAWVRSNLGTALHLSGSAPAGRPSDKGAVVDPTGRVLGVEGLKVVDLSVLPQVPSRGPMATAVMLGELLAGQS